MAPEKDPGVTRMRVPCREAGLTGTTGRLSTARPGKSNDQRKPSGRSIARPLSPVDPADERRRGNGTDKREQEWASRYPERGVTPCAESWDTLDRGTRR
jgi:hypothetical protein